MKDKQQRYAEAIKKATKDFNALPQDVRRIGSATESMMRIAQLKAEKARLKRSYERNIKEIDEHIGHLMEWVIKYGEQQNEQAEDN